jgi:hypothetical protein
MYCATGSELMLLELWQLAGSGFLQNRCLLLLSHSVSFPFSERYSCARPHARLLLRADYFVFESQML